MSHVLAAQQVYEREDSPRDFWQDVMAHLLNPTAYVIHSPEVFVMARPVNCLAATAEIVNPEIEFSPDQQNGWLVYLLAGSLRASLRHLPYYLPMIGWERKNALRWYALVDVVGRVDRVTFFKL